MILTERKLDAYQLSFDKEAAKKTTPDKEKTFKAYTDQQLITHIGERLNVVLSRGRFNIREGMLFGENTDVSMLGMVVNGRDYRRRHGNPFDFAREDAEVTGFKKIEDILTDEKSAIGTMVLSISPRGRDGSDYRHNFYDIFTLKKDEQGKYVETRRYSSALSPEESVGSLSEITTSELPFPDDVSFLANPILISSPTILNAEDLHKRLHKDHDFMEENEFLEIVRLNAPYREAYLQAALDQDPDLPIYYNAVLNSADMFAFKRDQKTIFVSPSAISTSTILNLGKEEVRKVATGCGSSGGAEDSPNRVSDFALSTFGKDKFGNIAVVCPSCGKINIRPEGELISVCGHCTSNEISCGSWE